MNCLLTGGSGFLGTKITALFQNCGIRIVNFDLVEPKVAFDANLYKYIPGDVRNISDFNKLDNEKIDFAIHLAARQFAGKVPYFGRNQWFFDVNVNGTQNLLEYMSEAGIHNLILFSTDMTYGLPNSCPVLPTQEQKPLGPYGLSKVKAESIIRSFPSINATIFRPRLITGPGRLGILTKLFKLIKAGLPVPMIGKGLNRYQMVSVSDCAKAALSAVDHNFPNKAYNLGSANPPTTLELLNAIIKHAHSSSHVIPIPSSFVKFCLKSLDSIGLTLLYPEQFLIADKDILLDTSETFSELGWKPEFEDIDCMCQAYDNFIKISE
jgi:dTDP-glucose 4,6-dehydratase